MLRFTGHARSDTGLVRRNNEDSGLLFPTVLLVADGVGGNAGGEIASATTAWTFYEHVHARGGLRPAGVLAAAAGESHHRLVRGVQADPGLAGTATTLTALLTDGHRCALIHAGDSRAYVLRDGDLIQVSEDHTWVHHQVSTGALTPLEASAHPWRHVLTRSLSARDTCDSEGPDLRPLDLRDGDRVLLCSDGLTDLVDAESIADVLRAHDDTPAVETLVDMALAAGGRDNVTVVVATVHEVPPDTRLVGEAFLGAVADHRHVLELPAPVLGVAG